MRFDLTDLQLLLNVADAGTITGGAESTFITLAAASERIRGMEDILGSPLFARSRRGVRPTAAGEVVLRHARLVVQQMEHLNGELRDLGAGLRGHVRLHCNTSAMSEHIPRLLGGFLQENPQISVQLEEQPSPVIVDALRDSACELGIVSSSVDTTGLACHAFRPDPLVLIAPRDHRLAAGSAVRLADVLHEPFIGLAEGSALQTLVTSEARRLGHRLLYRVRLLGMDSVCRMAGQGIGVAIVPLAVARRSARAAGVKVLRLTDRWADRSLVVCLRRDSELPSHAAKLLAHLVAGAVPEGRRRSASQRPVSPGPAQSL